MFYKNTLLRNFNWYEGNLHKSNINEVESKCLSIICIYFFILNKVHAKTEVSHMKKYMNICIIKILRDKMLKYFHGFLKLSHTHIHTHTLIHTLFLLCWSSVSAILWSSELRNRYFPEALLKESKYDGFAYTIHFVLLTL